MAEGGIKIPVTTDTSGLVKGIKKAEKEIVKVNEQTESELYKQKMLTEEKIVELVKERQKKLDKYTKNAIKKSGGTITYEELAYQFNNKGEGDWSYFHDVDTGEWLKAPKGYEEQLRNQMAIEQETYKELQHKEEIAKVENSVNKELEKQKDIQEEINENKPDDEQDDKAKKTSEILKIISAVIKKIGVTSIIILGVVAAIKALASGIISLFSKAIGFVLDQSKKVYTKLQVVKAMIDSIAQTLAPVMEAIINFILDAIIETLRFIQHAIYAISQVDIFKYTGEKLKDNMRKTAGYANDLRKELMGFDEANIIGDNGNTTAFNQGIANDIIKRLKIDEEYFDKSKKSWEQYVKDVNEIMSDPTRFKEEYGNWAWLFLVIGETWRMFINNIDGGFKIIEGLSKTITGIIESDWETAWEGIKETVIGIIQQMYNTILGRFIALPFEIGNAIGEWLRTNLSNLKIKIDGFLVDIHKKFDETIGSAIQWVVERINDIKKFLNEKFNFNLKVNADTSDAKKNLNEIIKGGATVLTMLNPTTAASTLGSKLGSSIGGLFSKLKLDGGGIVLPVPGHGVPIGGAVMSERRAEAILPFENPEVMAKMGEAIGKWVNISLQSNMVVDGRILATATNNQINKERFLMNR